MPTLIVGTIVGVVVYRRPKKPAIIVFALLSLLHVAVGLGFHPR